MCIEKDGKLTLVQDYDLLAFVQEFESTDTWGEDGKLTSIQVMVLLESDEGSMKKPHTQGERPPRV